MCNTELGCCDSLETKAKCDSIMRSSTAICMRRGSHGESSSFEPFDGADYRDAAGPTVHFPLTEKQVDPRAPRITETRNRFFEQTDAALAERAVA